MKFLAPATQISVVDVQDGVALRVILEPQKLTPGESVETTLSRERMLCYYVHHLIRAQWPAIDPSRIKDYISKPKPNGYQSLHHTSSIIHNDQEFPFEVQVRSSRMHRIAEFGVAAHFDYKVGSKAIAALPPASAVRHEESQVEIPALGVDVLVSGSEVAGNRVESDYISALQMARNELIKSNVYVFLPGTSTALEEGQLLSLPAGSRVSDFLLELRRKHGVKIEDSKFQVWLNGKVARLGDIVGNGDVLSLQDLNDVEMNLKSACPSS